MARHHTIDLGEFDPRLNGRWVRVREDLSLAQRKYIETAGFTIDRIETVEVEGPDGVVREKAQPIIRKMDMAVNQLATAEAAILDWNLETFDDEHEKISPIVTTRQDGTKSGGIYSDELPAWAGEIILAQIEGYYNVRGLGLDARKSAIGEPGSGAAGDEGAGPTG